MNSKNRQIKKTKAVYNKAEYIEKLVIKSLIVFSVIMAIFLVVLYQTLFGTLKKSNEIREISQGQSYYEIVHEWDNEKLLFSSTIAKAYLKWSVKKPLYLGTYQIPKNPSFLQMVQILQQGADSALVKVQIIEGKTAKDLYEKLRNTKNIKIEVLDKDVQQLKSMLDIKPYMPHVPESLSSNLEGWFAPNTYLYAEGTSDKIILEDLYKKQHHLLEVAWKNRVEGLPYKNKYEALIMASIIEKETGLPDEREEVAGVFVNRLRKGMKLQTDPTIIYGMGDRYNGNIRKKDIEEKTAYNTYQIRGLPPTPIALPSMASIDAALHPADTDALFFVATGYGGHKFSKNYEDHKKAVQAYLKVIKSKN